MLKKTLSCVALGLSLGALFPVSAAIADADLVRETCQKCHSNKQGDLTRIPEQRKTPEAWHMTIFRMRHLHGLKIDNKTQNKLIRYLSDTQGLAPSETEGLRYAYDRNPAAHETFEGPMAEMCGRCHTAARAALQRRTEEEWRLHIDFHVGQYPTIEYQAGGRDRHWYAIARDEIVPVLAKNYPLETEAWDQWLAADKPSAVGSWVVSTILPGSGPAFGVMNVEEKNGKLKLGGSLQSATGDVLPVSGTVNIYTGYEWRASVVVGNSKYRQILALSEDGGSLNGRHFLKSDDAMNTPFNAVKQDAMPSVLSAVPENIRAGSEADVYIVGSSLGNQVTVGEGLTVLSSEVTAFGMHLKVKADTGASGAVSVVVGDVGSELVVFQNLDRLSVEPDYAVSRVGGGGGSAPPVKAYFESVGWLNGADGKAETEDDIRVGRVESTWSLVNFDEHAESMEDAKYVGSLDSSTGIFSPATAGPNSGRPFSTNNAGNVKVIASFEDVEAEAQMIVTVQRWNDPPIR